MKARDRPLFLHSPSRPRNLQLFGMTVGRKEWAFADGLAKKGANQPFAAALQGLARACYNPWGGSSIFRGLATGAPASIAASCRIAASRISSRVHQ